MPSLGNLFVTIGAKTEGLDKGVDQSENKLKSLQSTMGGVVKTGAALGVAAGIAGAALITKLVNSGRIAIDSQAKLAQALDGTIGGLRALEMAAGDAGVAESELASQMARFNARLGEAERGTGAAHDALERLGLSARDFAGLDIDEKAALLADRMHELGLTSSQAQSELRDLGIRNENLATLMRSGGDAIRAQAEEVRNLGLNLSMVDAAQVEMANDALGVFGDVLTGIQDRLTVAAAPFITELSERFREAALESGGFKNEIEATINTIIKGFGKAADVIQGLRVVFKGIQLVVAGFAASAVSSLQVVLEGFSKLDEGVTYVANSVIDAMNTAFNTDIENIDPFTNSPFMQGLRDLGEESRNTVASLRGELAELAMQEMPSAKVDQFLADVTARSKEAATAVVDARAAMSGSGDYDASGGSEEEEEQKKFQAQLEAIKQRYLTEEELLREHREMMAVIGEEYDAANFETEAQWRAIKEQAEAEHMQRLHDITASGYQGIQSLINSHWGKAGAETAGAMKSILNTMAVGSRKAFEVSKAWAIADALISTFQGIAAGVKLGWPMAIPAVAWAAATGFAQVAAIKSQSFNGAGGAAAAGNGTPATAPNPVGVGGSTGGQQSNQTLTVAPIDPNAIFSGSAMMSFGQQIYDYSKDGGKVVFAQ